MRPLLAVSATVFALVLSGCGGNLTGAQPAGGSAMAGGAAFSGLHQPAAQQIPAPLAARIDVPASVEPADTHAAAYCKQTGGAVEVRRALYGTNGPQPLPLAGVATFCKYQSTSDGSRIYIKLNTLYTQKPSLATLAYIFAPADWLVLGQPRVVLLLAAGRIRSVRRHQRQRRRLVQEEIRGPSTRGMHLPRPLVHRFLGFGLSRKRHHPRHRLDEGYALQVPIVTRLLRQARERRVSAIASFSESASPAASIWRRGSMPSCCSSKPYTLR